MGGWLRTGATAAAAALLLVGVRKGAAQVVAEPALLTAGVSQRETFLPYLSFPENAYVIGGMIRVPVADDVDIGGRAGLWLIDGRDDTPFAGADIRYGLLARPLTPGGGHLALAFDVGVGVSEPGETVWKIPLGFIAGIGFSLAGGDSELFAHPRVELGASSGNDEFDSALLLDVGGVFTIMPQLGATIDLRFGDGIFREGNAIVVGLGVLWRL